jgi:hypothetical protein
VNLGYVNHPETFRGFPWDLRFVETVLLLKQVQIWELLWLMLSELNKWTNEENVCVTCTSVQSLQWVQAGPRCSDVFEFSSNILSYFDFGVRLVNNLLLLLEGCGNINHWKFNFIWNYAVAGVYRLFGPKMEEIIGYRKLHNDEVSNLCY